MAIRGADIGVGTTVALFVLGNTKTKPEPSFNAAASADLLREKKAPFSTFIICQYVWAALVGPPPG